MMEDLLPRHVAAVEVFADFAAEQPFPGEEQFIVRAVEDRRSEFVTARRCARTALARLGYAPVALRPGEAREPQWPDGVVGSITHCAGYRAAAVARSCELAGIGIDAEPSGPLPPAVLDMVTSRQEQAMLRALRRIDESTWWDRVLFSAKEAVYKAWFPLTRRWLAFEGVCLSIDPGTGCFTARLLVDGRRIDGGPPLTELCGRFTATSPFILTAVTIATQAA